MKAVYWRWGLLFAPGDFRSRYDDGRARLPTRRNFARRWPVDHCAQAAVNGGKAVDEPTERTAVRGAFQWSVGPGKGKFSELGC